MPCTRCGAELATSAHYCHACGHQVGGGLVPYAVKPNESVASLRLVSTIMPFGATRGPSTYRWALGIAAAATLVAAVLGALPVAVLLAALAIPLVYVVYLYDVNQWEDEPVLVTGVAFVLTAVLAAGWTAAWLALRGPSPSTVGDGSAAPVPSVASMLVPVLLAPLVGEVIRQVAPIVLASRDKFDDLMDGLTFGVIAGVSYATADTLVKHWALLSAGFPGTADADTWTSLLLLEGFVKPLVMGTASGLAGAEFSGLGRGHDGITPRYLLRVVEAIAANALFVLGVQVLLRWPGGVLGFVLSSVWGLAILAYLLIRLRRALQLGLTEAALESVARRRGVGEGELSHCEACEMPLLPDAAFCGACGKSLRATAKTGANQEVTR